MKTCPKFAPKTATPQRRRWASAVWLATGSLWAAAAVGCTLRQNAPVMPEVEPAGSAPPGVEPAEVDPEGDDAAERAP